MDHLTCTVQNAQRHLYTCLAGLTQHSSDKSSFSSAFHPATLPVQTQAGCHSPLFLACSVPSDQTHLAGAHRPSRPPLSCLIYCVDARHVASSGATAACLAVSHLSQYDHCMAPVLSPPQRSRLLCCVAVLAACPPTAGLAHPGRLHGVVRVPFAMQHALTPAQCSRSLATRHRTTVPPPDPRLPPHLVPPVSWLP